MPATAPRTSVWRLVVAGGLQLLLLPLCFALLMVASVSLGGAWLQRISQTGLSLLGIGVELTAIFGSIEVVRRWVLRWTWRDLGWHGWQPRWMALGAAQAFGAWLGILVLLLVTTGVHWERLPGRWSQPLFMMGLFVAVAVAEEVLFRGFWYSLLAHRLSPMGAAIGTSLAFSALHVFNPGWTWRAGFGVFLAGLVLAVGRWKTRGLAWPIAFHWGWNTAQGPLLGLPVSGLGLQGLWVARIAGPAWWTGGTFGPEAGVSAWLPLLVLLWWWLRQPEPTHPHNPKPESTS